MRKGKRKSAAKERIVKALWEVLQERGISLQDVERRLKKPTGWLYDRRRYSFDVGDLWAVLNAAEIDPLDFLTRTFPPKGAAQKVEEQQVAAQRVEEPPMSEVAAQILEQGNEVWEQGK